MTLSILKKRFTIWLLLIGMVVIVIAGFLSWRQDEKLAVEAVSWVISGRTFIIDPGHGGEDPGKVSPAGVLEKDINLAVAKKMQAIFVHGGGRVYMTREEDKSLNNGEDTVRARKRADLLKRVEIAHNMKADLYLSIHCNSFPSGKWSGAQTFYAQNIPGSKELATFIQEELINFPGNTTRKPKIDDTSLIFKEAKIPIVNVELGFLSNEEEEKMLQDSVYQDKLTWSIYSGVVRFLVESGDQYRPTLTPNINK